MKIQLDDRYTKQVRPLNEKEYEDLRRSIDYDCRINTPVVVDDEGYPLDGWHRLQVILEIFDGDESILVDPDPFIIPVHVLDGLTEDEKLKKAVELNWARRQLTDDEKHDLIVKTFLADTSKTHKEIGKEVGLTRGGVGYHLNQAVKDGILEKTNDWKTSKRLTSQDKLDILQAVRDGKTLSAVVKDLKFADSSVRSAIKWSVKEGHIDQNELDALLAQNRSAVLGRRKIPSDAEVYHRYKINGEKQVDMAGEFGVDPGSISQAVKRHSLVLKAQAEAEEGRAAKAVEEAAKIKAEKDAKAKEKAEAEAKAAAEIETQEKEADQKNVAPSSVDFAPWMTQLRLLMEEIDGVHRGTEKLIVADKAAAVTQLKEYSNLLTKRIVDRLCEKESNEDQDLEGQ